MLDRAIQIALLIGLATPLAAQEEAADGPWSGKATLGYLATTGNTETSNLNAGVELGYATGKWAHLLTANSIYSEDSNVTTAEAYKVSMKSERRIDDKQFLFGLVNWRKDRFSSYDQQISESVGYGRRLINNDIHKLNMEIGLGARQSDLVDGTEEDEFILRGGMDYTWAISDTASFVQTVSAEAGDNNTYIEGKSALSASLVGNLALVASYTVKHNTEVVPGTEKTDTYSALSLEYIW